MPAKRKKPIRKDAIIEGELAVVWEKMSELTQWVWGASDAGDHASDGT